ncbi:triphosphoribosyl-dephospho-CoA synthase CitG [Gemmiger sp.]
MSTSVTLPQMLIARENRVHTQQTLLAQYHTPLVCFTMNIAGPIKNSPLIRRGFVLGCRDLENALRREGMTILHKQTTDADTGNEAFYAVDADLLRLKKLTAELEDAAPVARLYDMDVLDVNGEKVDRTALALPVRRCLLCGAPAKECARSRRHTVEELQAKTRELLQTALDDHDAETIAQQATRALLFEVTTTPKPGLVDRRNTGSHRDMDSFTFMSSAAALYPYFKKCAEQGLRDAAENRAATDTFAALRPLGRQAESTMLAATSGVNTHKGAIFSIGIAVAALGRLDAERRRDPAAVLAECAAMTKGLVSRDYAHLTTAKTAGQRFYLAYGITGVRGQAEAGFPAVRNVGLPTLETGLKQGLGNDRAGAAALLAMLCADDDTNMIARGGREEQLRTTSKVAALLAETPYPDEETLARLDDEFIRKNLSPGGSADLLALCWLLHFFKTEAL